MFSAGKWMDPLCNAYERKNTARVVRSAIIIEQNNAQNVFWSRASLRNQHGSKIKIVNQKKQYYAYKFTCNTPLPIKNTSKSWMFIFQIKICKNNAKIS